MLCSEGHAWGSNQLILCPRTQQDCLRGGMLPTAGSRRSLRVSKSCKHLPLQNGPPASVVQLGKVPRGLQVAEVCKDSGRQRTWQLGVSQPWLHFQVWRCGGASIRAQGGGWCKRMAGQWQSSGQTRAEATGDVVPTRGACPGGESSTGLSPTLDTLFRSSPESGRHSALIRRMRQARPRSQIFKAE